jgi:hypothetical protein
MPAPPVRQYSFTDWQVNNPTAPPPGDRMDAEYDRGNQSITDTITWASISLNTDGSIRDAIIGQNNLVSGLFDDVAQGIIDQVQPMVDDAQSYATAAQTSASDAETAATAAGVSNTAAQAAASTAQTASTGAANQALAAASSAVTAKNAAADALNAADDAAGDLAASTDYAVLTQAWAEHMPDPIPPNILAIMGITGDHWSSRWWANKAANAFGELASLYLGAWPAPPSSTPTGDKIPPGAIYYNTTSGQPFVWDGTEWVPFFSPTKAYLLTLLYRATAGQTVFPLTVPDLGQQTYAISQTEAEPLEVYVNGARLPQDAPNPGNGDWNLDAATSTVTFLAPLSVGSMVQIDIMAPTSLLSPSRVQTQALLDFNIDPATGNPGQIDGTRATFPLALPDKTPVTVNSAQELFVSLDGVVQQPGTDFNVNSTTITFGEAPTIGARAWSTWYGAGGTTVVDYLPLTGGTLTGALTINSGTDPTLYITSSNTGVWPGVIIDGAAGYLQSIVNGHPRWEIDLGDGVAETGSNTGSNFGIFRYDDAGNGLDPNYVLFISRETGLVTLAAGLTVTGLVTTDPPPITTGVWNGYQIGLNMLGNAAQYGSAMVFGGPATDPFAFAWLRYNDALYLSTMPALDDTSGTYSEIDLVAFSQTNVHVLTDIIVDGAALFNGNATVGGGLTVIGPITTEADPAITGVSVDIEATGDINTGWAYLYTANQTGTADAGEAGVGTGSTDQGNGGTVYVYTANSNTGSSGSVFIYSGNTGGAAGKVCGDVKIWTGSAPNGATPGNLLLPGLPTADPHRAGAVWADAAAAFAMKVSQG